MQRLSNDSQSYIFVLNIMATQTPPNTTSPLQNPYNFVFVWSSSKTPITHMISTTRSFRISTIPICLYHHALETPHANSKEPPEAKISMF